MIPSIDELPQHLESELRAPEGPRLSLRLPRVPLGRLLAALPDEPAFLWRDATGRESAGLGVAARLSADGKDRFRAIRERMDAVASELGPGPHRFFGGFSFSPGTRGEDWNAFGDAHFILPRWRYEVVDDQEATLSLQFCRHFSPDLAERQLRRILDRIDPTAVTAPSQPAPIAITPPERASFLERVEEIRTLIAHGNASKIVLAHRCSVEFSRELDIGAFWTKLSGRFPTCTSFAFRPGEATFMGATPERLLLLRGQDLATEALAGSISPDVPDAAKTLLESRKNRAEHAVVADEIAHGLEPYATAVTRRPLEIRHLPNVLHLRTPIDARVRAGVHALELLETLHPTSAVGGMPRAAALDWIAARETSPRGWYSAPVGWVDSNGDGEFVVALRSALIDPRRAWLYAGAGIVRDSEPEQEFAETELKFSALLRTLGLATQGL